MRVVVAKWTGVPLHRMEQADNEKLLRMEGELRVIKQSMRELGDSILRLRNQLREVEVQADSQMQSRITPARDDKSAYDPPEFDRYTRLQELTRMMAESVNDVQTVQHNLMQAMDATDAALAAPYDADDTGGKDPRHGIEHHSRDGNGIDPGRAVGQRGEHVEPQSNARELHLVILCVEAVDQIGIGHCKDFGGHHVS